MKGVELHLVHGKWMTEAEVAERFGVRPHSIANWRTRHPREGGGPGLLEAYWDFRIAVERGELPPKGRRSAKRHRFRGKTVSVPEAARMIGIRYHTLWQYMNSNRCSLERAVKYYERKKTRRAIDAILEIINEGKPLK